jgi:hypothetical protein
MQNNPLRIRVCKIRGGGNYASKYGICKPQYIILA